jgi:O-antigen/teichoic acid export membrane protein
MTAPSVKRNLVANFGGNIWRGIAALVFIPFYLRFLGPEAYGLIGFYTTLLGVFVVLDLGLATTLSREMARLSVDDKNKKEMHNIVHSIEIIYWIVGLVIGLIIFFGSSIISTKWVNAEEMQIQTIEQAVSLMGITFALQWPSAIYKGALLGLQKHVKLNIILASTSTYRGIITLLMLWQLSNTIQVFFYPRSLQTSSKSY